jgi:hypothetical protein
MEVIIAACRYVRAFGDTQSARPAHPAPSLCADSAIGRSRRQTRRARCETAVNCVTI